MCGHLILNSMRHRLCQVSFMMAKSISLSVVKEIKENEKELVETA